MLDLMIKNALVVLPGGAEKVCVGVRDGKIVSIGSDEMESQKTIDAAGKILIPGGVEGHAHIWEPMHEGWTNGKEEWLADSEGTTRAALFGGTTSVASFAFMDVHSTEVIYNVAKAVETRKKVFQNHSFTHFVFHPVLTGTPSDETIESIKQAIEEGTTSFKVFTTDVTSKQAGVRIETGSMLAIMKVLAENNGILMVHAEDDELVRYMEARLGREGKDQAYNLNLVHSSLSEGIAFNKVLQLAAEAGSATYFAHVTGRRGIREMRRAQREGQAVYGEVLHNYLMFSNEDYHKENGIRFHTYPAMKDVEDQKALWEALADGTLTMVSTDEYTTPYKTKVQGQTVETACGGLNGIETRGIVAFSEGYKKGRLSLERFTEIFSTNPAKVLGLYPQKGTIQIGSDADLVLWDPDVEKTVTLDDLHQPSDYSIFVGMEAKGWPVTVILDGKVVVEDGKLYGKPTDGRFIKRRMTEEVLNGYYKDR